MITGAAAETYFKEKYISLPVFKNRTLVDTTLWGCGFDFALVSTQKEPLFGVEIKGLAGTTGTITLTEKEYNTAETLKENYFLFIVSNFNSTPVHRTIRNPLSCSLNMKKSEIIRQHIYSFKI